MTEINSPIDFESQFRHSMLIELLDLDLILDITHNEVKILMIIKIKVLNAANDCVIEHLRFFF